MSGWIDPLGTRALLRYIRAEQRRLEALIEERERLHPHSRRTSKFRARHDALGHFGMLIQAMQRPGKELLPYKTLVNAGPLDERRAMIENLVPRTH
jgi:hypothetical protein